MSTRDLLIVSKTPDFFTPTIGLINICPHLNSLPHHRGHIRLPTAIPTRSVTNRPEIMLNKTRIPKANSQFKTPSLAQYQMQTIKRPKQLPLNFSNNDGFNKITIWTCTFFPCWTCRDQWEWKKMAKNASLSNKLSWLAPVWLDCMHIGVVCRCSRTRGFHLMNPAIIWNFERALSIFSVQIIDSEINWCHLQRPSSSFNVFQLNLLLPSYRHNSNNFHS